MERESGAFSMSEIVLPMKLENVKSVIDVHLQSFRGFFLTLLGRGFLTELYRDIITDPSGIAFVWFADERVVGFVAGTDHSAEFYNRLLRKRWWRFGLAAFPAIIKKPPMVHRLLRALNLPKQMIAKDGRGTLMSFAVLPGYQNRDIGHYLLKAFLEEAMKRGLHQVDLITDKVNNDSANAFYLREGFYQLRSFETPERRQMNEYVINLPAKDNNEQPF
jgi:ribosomal protein S18 acetylase RimI-like enzyme